MKNWFSAQSLAKELSFASCKDAEFRKGVRYLVREGAIEIQQSGFKGDSLHHQKLYVVRDFYTVFLHFFGRKNEEQASEQIACLKSKMNRKKSSTFRRFSEWDRIDVLKEDQTLPVSSRGAGLCLYLPKDICEVYGLIAGDMLKIRMLDHFRKASLSSGDGKDKETAVSGQPPR